MEVIAKEDFPQESPQEGVDIRQTQFQIWVGRRTRKDREQDEGWELQVKQAGGMGSEYGDCSDPSRAFCMILRS